EGKFKQWAVWCDWLALKRDFVARRRKVWIETRNQPNLHANIYFANARYCVSTVGTDNLDIRRSLTSGVMHYNTLIAEKFKLG
ncbi:MAG: hypothetical protein WCA20_26720, partial [Candidatus Sulfotelmatobacter sp.]